MSTKKNSPHSSASKVVSISRPATRTARTDVLRLLQGKVTETPPSLAFSSPEYVYSAGTTGRIMRRLGKVVSRNRRGIYACELLDEFGRVTGYAVFSSGGLHVRDCQTLEEAEELLKENLT